MSVSEIQKMFCPSCGAPIVFEEGREDTFCSHCGCQLHRDDENIVRRMEHVERKLEHEEKKMEYADRHEEREYTLEREAQQRKEAFICIAILIILGLIMFLVVFPILF